MEGDTPSVSPDASAPRFGTSRAWDGIFVVLMGWHLWLCMGLFEGDKPGALVLNEEPILSGRHALHLYHGYLGAQALYHDGRTLVYDPVCYAGYLKTPWYDAGSKPAELFLLTAKGQLLPSVYKLGVFGVWLLLPAIAGLAARVMGLSPGTSCLAAGLTFAVAWSQYGRERLWGGDVDLLMGAELAMLTLALAVNAHLRPHAVSFVFFALAAWLLCQIQPLVFLALLPALLICYFAVGANHRLAWHLGVLGVLALAIGGNWYWLHDALRYWWVRSEANPVPFASSTSVGQLLLRAPVLKDEVHKGFAAILLVAATVGIGCMAYFQRSLAARTLGTALVTYLAIGLLGPAWDPTSRIDPSRSFVIAIFIATLPAADALVQAFDWLGQATGTRLRGAVVALGVLATVGAGLHSPLKALGKTILLREKLPVGLSPELRTTVEELRKNTTTEARILWEEDGPGQAYAPLLPWFTERYFMSGQGAAGLIEHAMCGLAEGKLEGRSLADWTDRDLSDYCRRYNVGWVVCRSDKAKQRFADWQTAATLTELPLGRLFEIRQAASYVLVGQGRVERCDHNVLTLTDVVPSQGQVVLSFHHHAGIRPSVDRVTVEKEPQLHDPIPLLRLRVPAPIARLTLTWTDERGRHSLIQHDYRESHRQRQVMGITIRTETPADYEAIRHVVSLAFGRNDEARLVDVLREAGYARASLVAEKDGQVVGHVLYSDLPITTASGVVSALALAPMAVLPECQNQGIGSELVRRSLEHCRAAGHRIVIVVGHPRYYPRFGFSRELASSLESVYTGEAFMALELTPGALDGVKGRVDYPPPFCAF